MQNSSPSQAIALPPTPSTSGAPITSDGWTLPVAHTDSDPRWRRAWTALHEVYEDNVGMLLIATAQLFFTFMNICVKLLDGLETPVPTLELVIVRMVMTYIFSLSYMMLRKIPHAVLGPPEVRFLLFLRGVAGFISLFGIYYSLKYLSLSDSAVLTFLSPTTTGIAGYLFLREALTRKEVFAGLLSLSGVILIAQPQALFGTTASGGDGLDETHDMDRSASLNNVTPNQRLIAVGVALLGVLGATGAYISLRAIGTRAHPLHSLTFFSSYCVLVSTAAMLALGITPVIPSHWRWGGLLVAVGACGLIAQVLLVLGLQRETASRGSLAMYMQLIFATFFERVLFGVTPSYLSLLGMGVIIGSGLYVVVNKAKKQDAYKRLPQDAEDLEAHELMASPDSPVELVQHK